MYKFPLGSPEIALQEPEETHTPDKENGVHCTCTIPRWNRLDLTLPEMRGSRAVHTTGIVSNASSSANAAISAMWAIFRQAVQLQYNSTMQYTVYTVYTVPYIYLNSEFLWPV